MPCDILSYSWEVHYLVALYVQKKPTKKCLSLLQPGTVPFYPLDLLQENLYSRKRYLKHFMSLLVTDSQSYRC